MTASSLTVPEIVCAQCSESKPAGDFIGRRGRQTTYCSACRTKYYGGLPHISGEENATLIVERPPAWHARRSKVEPTTRLTKRDRESGRVHLSLLKEAGIDPDAERPRTRGDCVDGPRPCPWVSCSHHLYLDALATGNIQLNFPDREPSDMARSCALDIADDGGASLEDVATAMNFSRERARQIESKALRTFHTRAVRSGRFDVDDHDGPTRRPSEHTTIGRSKAAAATPENEDEARQPPEDEHVGRVSFFAEGEGADELVCAAVWGMFVKDSNGRGFDARTPGQRKLAAHLAKKRAEAGLAAKGAEGLLPLRLRSVLLSFRSLSTELGRKPTAREIAGRAYVSGKTDVQKIANVNAALHQLRKRELLPSRATESIAAVPAAPATETTKETPTMADQEKDLTDRERTLLETYRSLSEKNGAPPARLELARAAGLTAPNDSALSSAIYNATKRLVARGLMPKGRMGGAHAPALARPRKAKPKPSAKLRAPRASRPAPKPTPIRSTSSSLDVLRAELAAVGRRADALRDAIAILEQPFDEVAS